MVRSPLAISILVMIDVFKECAGQDHSTLHSLRNQTCGVRLPKQSSGLGTWKVLCHMCRGNMDLATASVQQPLCSVATVGKLIVATAVIAVVVIVVIVVIAAIGSPPLQLADDVQVVTDDQALVVLGPGISWKSSVCNSSSLSPATGTEQGQGPEP